MANSSSFFEKWMTQRRTRKAKALSDGYIDVVDLYKKGLVSVTGTGQSITGISAEIVSRVDVPLNVSLSCGTYFVSHGNHQNMATRQEYQFTLRPLVAQTIHVQASCVNASMRIPNHKDRFKGVGRLSNKVRLFMETAQREHADAMTIQAGIWALTDRLSRDAIRLNLQRRRPAQDDPFPWSPTSLEDRAVRRSPWIYEPAISHDQIDKAVELLDCLGFGHNLYRNVCEETDSETTRSQPVFGS
jgi:hypothetical protein